MHKTIILGDEHDESLRAALLDVLQELGADPVGADWGVAGSQELATWKVVVDDDVVTIEAETYIGLSISGDAILVSDIAYRVATHGRAERRRE